MELHTSWRCDRRGEERRGIHVCLGENTRGITQIDEELSLVSVGLLAAGLGVTFAPLLVLLAVAAVAGGAMTAMGALFLLIQRSTEAKLRPYTTPLDRLNLALLVALGALCAAVALAPGV